MILIAILVCHVHPVVATWWLIVVCLGVAIVQVALWLVLEARELTGGLPEGPADVPLLDGVALRSALARRLAVHVQIGGVHGIALYV